MGRFYPVPGFSNSSKFTESPSTFGQMCMKFKCFLVSLSPTPHKFGAQELISLQFEYMYSVKIYGFLLIYGSETQTSRYLVFLLLIQATKRLRTPSILSPWPGTAGRYRHRGEDHRESSVLKLLTVLFPCSPGLCFSVRYHHPPNGGGGAGIKHAKESLWL